FIGGGKTRFVAALCAAVIALPCHALDAAATATALRLRNAITGGTLPVTDPIFLSMVAQVQAGDVLGAARTAADTKYFAGYLARRLALQMQSPALDATGINDNDGSAFLIAHFVGAGGVSARISTIWSESATYQVTKANGDVVHAAELSSDDLATVDWRQMLRTGGQQDANGVFLPVKHVGGYTTASDRANDGSYAIYGATAGTNLRMIEGIWEIATGLTLTDVASAVASPNQVPRFVPEYDPSFFKGQGQAACISCHGGGMSSLNHGYATVANVFDVDGNGFVFIENPTTNTMKSLGSDPNARNRVQACNLSRTPTPVCNPESPDVDPQQGWDVSQVWQQSGTLRTMGWMAPMQGHGLQELGFAIGQSWIVYQVLTNRVIAEMCPLGTFSTTEINRIAATANPWADPAGTDDLRTIVAQVAASAGCR
ncbi:MAG: hypothetical protein ACXVA9_01195, partial [Bdellovibrionales bacterium]